MLWLNYDKINNLPLWGPNTQLSFLASSVKMSKQMQMEEEMFLVDKIFQDHNLKIGDQKN